MIQINFSKKEIKELHYQRYYHPHPRVRQRVEALYIKSQGYPHKDICTILRISKKTLVKYLNAYLEGGIKKLMDVNFYQPTSELDQHKIIIKKYFKQHPPVSINEAQSKIEEITSIKRNPTQIKSFLKRIGMKCIKIGSIPGKAITEEKIEEQETFKKQELEPRIKEAKEGKRTLFLLMLPILFMEHF